MTDRIMPEIEEMQSQIPLTPINTPATIGAAAEASQITDSPPGLDVNQKFESGLSQGISVYRGMLDKSVESETYRSPAMYSGMSANASHYRLNTPLSDMSCNDVGVQTECTLAIGLDKIVWEPKLVNAVTEPRITGADAKLEFAVRAQEADALPGLEQTAVVDTMVGLGKTMENAGISEVCRSLDALQRSLQALNTRDESESEATTSVAERVEVIEERIVPPPQAPEGVRSRRMRMKKTEDRRMFVLSESNSSEEERDGGKEEADLLVIDEKETSVKKGKGSAAARK